MLASGAAGTVRVNPQILIPDFYIHILLNLRHNIAAYKRSLALSCRVEGRNPYQTVNPLFRLQVAIGVLPVYLEGNRLNARFLSVQIIQHFHLVAFLSAHLVYIL